MEVKVPQYTIQTATRKHSFFRQHWIMFSLLGLAVVTFLLGKYSNLDMLQAFKGQKQTWSELNQKLSEENEANKRTISQLQTAVKVKEQAIAELQQNINDINKQKAALQADLVFYENLLSHKDQIRSLRVFEVQAEPAGSLVKLKLVLAQKLQRAQVIKGSIDLKLKGIQESTGQTLDLIEQYDLEDAYEFKYFEIKNYTISIPDGFNPTELLVELKSSNKKTVSEQFQWADIMQPSNTSDLDNLTLTQN